MHYYQFHIGDYVAHTRHLTLIEDLAYRRLLDLYYLQEKPIIAESAARQIGMREHGQDVLAVLVEFWQETEKGFINKRADEEIAAFKAMSEGGKKGAAIRWGKATDSPPIATPLHPPIATNNHKPITNNHKNIYDAKASLVSVGAKASLVKDWFSVRKVKRLANTETAITGFINKVQKAGLDINDVLTLCCQKGWGGFEPAWMNDEKPNNGPPWWSSEKLMVEEGKKHGISPRGGESWQDFKGRIQQAKEVRA